jgi:RNA polymerase sigma-70 factor (ECF subfamily)
MIDSSVDSVNSALKRARASLRLPPPRPPARDRDSHDERALVAKFVRAWEAGDVDELVALLTSDVSVTMPPIPLEYHGLDDVTRFVATFMRRRSHDLLPARANGQPAFGAYLRASTGGIRHGTGLFVLTLAGDRISAMTRFDAAVLRWFGLPQSLSD